MGHDPIEEILSGDVLLWRVSWLSYFGHDKVVETKPLDQKMTMDITIIFWRKKMNVGQSSCFCSIQIVRHSFEFIGREGKLCEEEFFNEDFFRNATNIGV